MTNRQGYLYAEDDPLSRRAMSMIIEKNMKETLIVFDDTADFMERLHEISITPKLIMLDIHIQPSSGFEVLKMIRAEDTYNNVPVVALTASVMNEEIKQLQGAGFNGAIAKPFSIKTLPDLLRRIEAGESVWKVIDG